jgi:hypothetical protein
VIPFAFHSKTLLYEIAFAFGGVVVTTFIFHLYARWGRAA